MATSNGHRSNSTAEKVDRVHSKSARPLAIRRRRDWRFSEDYRGRLHPLLSRFVGYRPPDAQPPYDPLPFPPFSWLSKISLRHEVWIMGWLGAFGGILLIEAIMSTSTAFRDVYTAPLIVTSFGASAVLVFGVCESPLAQPRNFVLGHFVSALIGTCITRLFVLNGSYLGRLDNTSFHPSTFINGGLSMATSLLGQLVFGVVHPPAGATGLNAAVQSQIVVLSWRYLPTVLASSLIMLGWALIINNVGRHRYPIYWWAAGSSWVREKRDDEIIGSLRTLEENPLRQAEDQGRTAEALLFDRLESPGSERVRNMGSYITAADGERNVDETEGQGETTQPSSANLQK